MKGKARQSKAKQGKARQSKARQGKTCDLGMLSGHHTRACTHMHTHAWRILCSSLCSSFSSLFCITPGPGTHFSPPKRSVTFASISLIRGTIEVPANGGVVCLCVHVCVCESVFLSLITTCTTHVHAHAHAHAHALAGPSDTDTPVPVQFDIAGPMSVSAVFAIIVFSCSIVG
jgi:hypothetical protein